MCDYVYDMLCILCPIISNHNGISECAHIVKIALKYTICILLLYLSKCCHIMLVRNKNLFQRVSICNIFT